MEHLKKEELRVRFPGLHVESTDRALFSDQGAIIDAELAHKVRLRHSIAQRQRLSEAVCSDGDGHVSRVW